MTIPTQHTVNTPYMVGPVHCYTLERDGNLILIDTGPPTETGRRYLEREVDLSRLTHVLVTHCHLDHYGQAAWLAEHTGAAVYLPYRDILKHRLHEQRMAAMYEILGDMGFNPDYLDTLGEAFSRGALLPPFPRRHFVAEHDLPAGLGIEILACPGHSQSDLVYCGDTWAVTGDTLLRGVFQSPLLDVDLECGGRFRNYEAYCRSVVTLAGVRDKTVLPGHRSGIDTVDATIMFYVSKTLHRVRSLKPALETLTIAEVIDQVFTGMTDPFHIYLKTSEIAFMKDFLEQPDLLRFALEEIGLFGQAAELFHAVTGR